MSSWEDIDAFLSGQVALFPPEPGQTVRDVGGTSLHSVSRARDYGDALYGQVGCWVIYNALVPYAQGPGAVLEELFWDPSGSGWKNGQDIGPIGGHSDHVHAGIAVGAVFPGSPSPNAGGVTTKPEAHGVKIIDYKPLKQILQFGVNGLGQLLQSSYAPKGGILLQDKILLTGLVPGVLDVTVDDGNVIRVGAQLVAGNNAYVYYLPGKGWFNAFDQALPS